MINMSELKSYCHVPNCRDLIGHPRVIKASNDALERYGFSRQRIAQMDDEQFSYFRSHVGRNISLVITELKRSIIRNMEVSLSEFSLELLESYVFSHYIISTIDKKLILHVGIESDTLKTLFKENGWNSCAFITAENPDGEMVSDAENDKNQTALMSALDENNLPYLKGEGVGVNQDWPSESSVCIFDLGFGEALAIASEFSQLAFVWVASDGVPKIVIVGGSASQDIHLV